MSIIIRKKEIVLQDCGGDESQNWVIRYYVIENLNPIRKREIISKSLTKEERYIFAKKRIAELSKNCDEKGHVILENIEKVTSEKKEKYEKTLHFILDEAIKSKIGTMAARSISCAYRPALTHFKKFCDENLIPQKFERSNGYLFRNYLLELDLKKKTVNSYVSVIRELITEAGRIGLVAETYNPMNKIPLLPAVMKAQEVFSEEHFTQIYNYCLEFDKTLFRFISFMFYTCNRPDSLRLLKIGDIDLVNRKIRFLAENQKTSVRRFQPISDAFYSELERMNLDRYPKNYFVFGLNGEPAYMKVGVNFFSKRHRQMLKTLNLKHFDYKMYAWKHTGAVYLYESIRDLKRVSEHLFHTDIKTTLIYLQRYGVVFGDGEFEKKAPKFSR